MVDLGNRTLRAVRLIHADGDELRQVAFPARRHRAATAGIKGLIRLWDPVLRPGARHPDRPSRQINGLAFSPDGTILGSVAHDGSVRL